MRRGLSRHSNKSSGNFFSPLSLFAGGVNGVWYDPSDSSTLFEDTAGTTPSPTPGGGALSVVGKMLDKSGNGNHAISYNTTTARPELSARVNLLTYSEQFDNPAWNKFRSTAVSTTATTDPLGGTTAKKLTPSAGLTSGQIYNNIAVTISSGASYTTLIWIKAAELGFAFVSNYTRASDLQAGVCVNLSTGERTNAGANGTYSVSDAGNGWWAVSISTSATTTNGYIEVHPLAAAGLPGSYTGDGTSGIYIWGADLRPANIGTSVPAYQRIADQYTYDSSGFPRYLVFNGTASGMYTPANLNLSATDKATVFAGVRKQAASGRAMLVELSASAANQGAFNVTAPEATNDYAFSVTGNAGSPYYQPAGYAAPISNVLSCVYDFAGALLVNEIAPRINGVLAQSGGAGTSAGTNTAFLSAPLNIGVRNAQGGAPTILFFNGYIYSLIVVGAASTAAQISSTESWINGKEGGVY